MDKKRRAGPARRRRARGRIRLFSFALLAVALLLWQATETGAQEATPASDDGLRAAHLAPDGCSELVLNGGFEATGLHWGLLGTTAPPSYATERALAGARSMRLGIVDSANLDASDSLYQDIALPDSAQHFTLSFHYWAVHEDAPGSDAQLLNIYEATTGVRLAQPWSQLSNGQTWQFKQIDVTQFRGRMVRLEFGVHNDGDGGRTALYLDDVSLLACEPDATPFVTPSATPRPSVAPQPSATPQPPTATPAPSGCVEDGALKNGDFEEALDERANWTVGVAAASPVLSKQAASGAWSLQLGNPPDGGAQNFSSYSSVRQLIRLPADAASASARWSHLSRSQEPEANNPSLSTDRQELVLLTSSLGTAAILYRSRADNSGWETETVDLTPFLGGSYYLYFNVFNDGDGKRTWMLLDDVAVRVCYKNAAAPRRGPRATETRPPTAAQDKSAAARPESDAETPTPPSSGEADVGAAPTLPVRGTIIAVGMSTPSGMIRRSSPSARAPEAASVSVWQRFRRISQTAQGQTFLILLLTVLAAIGYLRFRESRQ